jgi:hypothetical protein
MAYGVYGHLSHDGNRSKREITLFLIPIDDIDDHGTFVHHLLGQYDGPVVQNMGKSNSQLLGTHQTLGCHHQMMKETCPKMGGMWPQFTIF